MLLVAPYQLYKKEFLRANEAEEKLRPKISLEVGSVDFEKRLYHIKVKNAGVEAIEACTGYLKRVFPKIEDNYTLHSDISTRQLSWSKGFGSGVVVDFVSEAELLLTYEKSIPGSFSVTYLFPDDDMCIIPCVFEVEVKAKNSVPAKGYFYLSLYPYEFKKIDDFTVPLIFREET